MRAHSVTLAPAAGGDGSAVSSGRLGPVSGQLFRYGIFYETAASGNVTITIKHSVGPDEVIHSAVTGAAGWFNPTVGRSDDDGAAVPNEFDLYAVDGYLLVELAAADDDAVVSVVAYIGDR